MEIKKYRYAKGEVWQRIVYVGVILAFIFLAVRRHQTGEGHALAGWFPVGVLVALGLFAFRGLYDHRPVLIFSGDGIWFAGWHLEQAIVWDDIQKVKFIPAPRGEPWITLVLTATAAERYKRPEFQFRTGTLDVRGTEVLKLVEAYRSAARQAP